VVYIWIFVVILDEVYALNTTYSPTHGCSFILACEAL
jgi:hypothetical protein